MRYFSTMLAAGLFLFCSCSSSNFISKTAEKEVITVQGLTNAHVGICIYDVSSQKNVYTYQSDKYFVPASNIKLVSLYAGLSCLGDSLPGIRYKESNGAIIIQPTGDPTLLHPDFKEQPIAIWLKNSNKSIYINSNNWKDQPLGYGWSWDDYNAAYMTERSALPVYGNIIKWTQVNEPSKTEPFVYSEPEVNWKVNFNPEKTNQFKVTRNRDANIYTISEGREMVKSVELPFYTDGIAAALELLKDTVYKTIQPTEENINGYQTLFSQASDTMYRLMMLRSDNFFADQTLLMAANEKTGVMNTAKIIDSLLHHQLKEFPQKPNWVDGSGLSRYNLFTPQDFVWLLKKMKDEFGWKRISHILATGNEGTLKNYYTALNGKIFAKTGTLSGHVALSGFMTTSHNRQLIFSVLVNNHQTSATAVRRAVEKMMMQVYNKY